MQESYLAKDRDSAKEFLKEKIDSGYAGLYITRNDELDPATKLILTGKHRVRDIKTTIMDFMNDNKKSAILLDRIDYLVNNYGFDEVLNLVYMINDMAKDKKNVFLVNVNPAALNTAQMAMLKEELRELKGRLDLRDDLGEIIKFTAKQETVLFKDITKACSITKATTRKRLHELSGLGLIEIWKNGRTKVVRLTEKAKNTLS